MRRPLSIVDPTVRIRFLFKKLGNGKLSPDSGGINTWMTRINKAESEKKAKSHARVSVLKSMRAKGSFFAPPPVTATFK
jgi:hypothetical protein